MQGGGGVEEGLHWDVEGQCRSSVSWVTVTAPLFFWSRRKFAFQCLGEPCYFLQSALTQGLAEEFSPPYLDETIQRMQKEPSAPPKHWTQHIRSFWDGVAGPLTLLNVLASALRHGNILPQLWKRDFKKSTIVSSAFCSSEGLFLPPWSDLTLTLSPAASINWLSRSARRKGKKKTQSTHAHRLPDGEVILCVGRRVSSLTDVGFYLQVCARVYVRAAALMIAVVTLLLWEDRAALTMTEIQVSWKKKEKYCVVFWIQCKKKYNLL